VKIKHIHLKQYPYITTTVTINREPIFKKHKAANILLDTILSGKRQSWYYLISFIIMLDHIHLIIVPREKNISECMKSIKGFSSRQINKLFDRKGSIWQAGYYDYILDNEDKILSRIRYVEENPVRKGLVTRAEYYKYSSARYRNETDYGMFF
jgi:REP element-mobilizing transposase RayT